MDKYVVGFCFNGALSKVVLIKKNRPEWQKDSLNGVGGKIKYREPPLFAMAREFEEEAGLKIPPSMWTEYCEISRKNFSVKFFFAVLSGVSKAKTMEDEEIILMDIADVFNHKHISNLKWLIPLALYKIRFTEEIIVLKQEQQSKAIKE